MDDHDFNIVVFAYFFKGFQKSVFYGVRKSVLAFPVSHFNNADGSLHGKVYRFVHARLLGLSSTHILGDSL